VHVKTKGNWQIGDIGKFGAATTDRVVFVDLSAEIPQFFIAGGDEARTTVTQRHEQWLASVGHVRPQTPDSKHSAVDEELVERWRNRWSLFE
jgi:hypothetical protein